MKRIITAVALFAVTGLAHAGLSFSELSSDVVRTEAFNVSGLPNYGVGTKLSIGALVTDQKGRVTFTYLGQESGYVSEFKLLINNSSLLESNKVGKSVSAWVEDIGAIKFKFTENTSPSNYAMNGGYWAPNTSIGLIAENVKVGKNKYAFVLGYNDSAGSARLGDWDDFVVGVNFTPAPIPEPETYAMLMLGLTAVGFISRRRKAQVKVSV